MHDISFALVNGAYVMRSRRTFITVIASHCGKTSWTGHALFFLLKLQAYEST